MPVDVDVEVILTRPVNFGYGSSLMKYTGWCQNDSTPIASRLLDERGAGVHGLGLLPPPPARRQLAVGPRRGRLTKSF